MILRSSTQGMREITYGQVLRLIAEMRPEILNSPSNEVLRMKNLSTGEILTIEEDRVQIHLFKQLADLAAGRIKTDQLKKIPRGIYPDLYARKMNKKSCKQAVVFLCRQIGDLSDRIPGSDDRQFWRKLEKAFPL